MRVRARSEERRKNLGDELNVGIELDARRAFSSRTWHPSTKQRNTSIPRQTTKFFATTLSKQVSTRTNCDGTLYYTAYWQYQ